EDAMEHADDIPTINDIELLKVGRHFRMTPAEKLVVGRNKDENEVIKALVEDADVVLEAKNHVGPTCILRGKSHDEATIAKAAGIALRYSDAPKDTKSTVKVTIAGREQELEAMPAGISETDALRI
ncbi:MAG TPA: hypothetical protein VFT58_00290, partial [Nitrososphaera sp.]|nr:hypothetical protein [Nitrososphaera sp.]